MPPNISFRGYSTLFFHKVTEADPDLPVTQFAVACLDRNLPITEVARRFSVTRATVYNWFTGKSTPRKHQQEMMQALLIRWQRKGPSNIRNTAS